ncbi:beta-lactamase/transpeptidase-like protein [Mycena amicta]|nr:beta-lactamase/transpeptidase-like protein [Mycena amicta]
MSANNVFESNETLRAYLSQLILPSHLRGTSESLEEYAKIPLLTATFGLRDSTDASSAIDTETVFQAASISKPFTALAVLRLVVQGKLDLDVDIAEYLALDKTADAIARDGLHHSSLVNPATAPRTLITLRLLLAHRSGLTTVSGLPGYYKPLTDIPSTISSLNGTAPANHPPIRAFTLPGLGTSYSGGGTTLIQHILSLVTGKPFPELMRELVLVPLGMNHSTYEQRVDSNQARAHNTAHEGYPGISDSEEMGMNYPEMAAAGLRTTPNDLLRGLRVVYDCLLGTNSFLPPALVAESFTESAGWGKFGIGWQVETLRTDNATGLHHSIIGHGGANQGFQCTLRVVGEVPSNSTGLKNSKPPVGIAWMTNGDEGSHIGGRIAAALGWLIDEPLTGPLQLFFPVLARTQEEDAKVEKQIRGWEKWVGQWKMKDEGGESNPQVSFDIFESENRPVLRVSTHTEPLQLLPAACYKPDVIVWVVRDMEVCVAMKTIKKDEVESISLEVWQNESVFVGERA